MAESIYNIEPSRDTIESREYVTIFCCPKINLSLQNAGLSVNIDNKFENESPEREIEGLSCGTARRGCVWIDDRLYDRDDDRESRESDARCEIPVPARTVQCTVRSERRDAAILSRSITNRPSILACVLGCTQCDSTLYYSNCFKTLES
jgi:hypothetical protein